jgi:uncharacterized protein (DUF362 family)/ferredoxin
MNKVSIVECRNYNPADVLKAVRRSVDLLGGLTKFVPTKSKVLVKPNFLAPHAASKAALTHSAVIEAVCELVFEVGATPIVGDSSSIGSSKLIARRSGVLPYLEKRGIELIDLQDSRTYENKTGKNFKRFEVSAEAVNADVIINLPKLKTHGQILMTMAVKNMFGVIVGMRKSQWHLRAGKDAIYFARMLVELCYFLKPSLSIIDAVIGMDGNGPGSGRPREIGLVAASADPVSLDRVMANIVGVDPEKILTLLAARELGYGPTSLSQIETVGDNPDSFHIDDFLLPRLSPASTTKGTLDPISGIFQNALTSKPVIDHKLCTHCMTCSEQCPLDAISFDENALAGSKTGFLEIDYKKCIRCYCCQEICPEGAITIRDGWGIRMMSLLGR